jgi:predicted acyl esterase
MNTFSRGLLCVLLLSQTSSMPFGAGGQAAGQSQAPGSRGNPYEIQPPSDGSLAYRIIPTPKAMVIEKDVIVTMADGVKLAANIYRPDKPGRFPLVLAMTPYGKDQTPPTFNPDGSPARDSYTPFVDRVYAHGPDLGHMKISLLTPWEGPDPAFWVPNDYAVMIVDCRGGFKSEGKAPTAVQQGDDISRSSSGPPPGRGATATWG